MKGRLTGAGICAAVLAAIFAADTEAERQVPIEKLIYDRQLQALQREGLRGAAAVTGTYVGEALSADFGSPTSLSALVSSSEIIVAATVIHNRCVMTRDGLSILTHYFARTDEVIKGTSPSNRELRLIVPGGRVAFPDGSWAQLNLKGFIRPETGESYVLFLKSASSLYRTENAIDDSSYMPVFGPLGVYHLKPVGRIIPAGGYRTAFGRSIASGRLTSAEFLTMIRSIAREN